MLMESRDHFNAALPAQGRLLGLDPGSNTIGLALSDFGRSLARPLETIVRKKFSVDIERLKQVITQQSIVGLVIGYPLNMDGSEGERCQSVRAFVRNLETHFDLPILLWDERLSTSAAHDAMIAAGVRAARRQEKVDKIAAAFILQSALDA